MNIHDIVNQEKTWTLQSQWFSWSCGFMVNGQAQSAPFKSLGSRLYDYGDSGVYVGLHEFLCIDRDTHDCWEWSGHWRLVHRADGCVYGDGCRWPQKNGWVLVEQEADQVRLVLIYDDGRKDILHQSWGIGSPRISPAGDLLYVSWDKEHMPWDQTDVWWMQIDGQKKKLILPTAAWMQPIWLNDTHVLTLGDPEGRWQCYQLELSSQTLTPFVSTSGEIGDAEWSRGMRFHAYLDGAWCGVIHYAGLARWVLQDSSGLQHILPIQGVHTDIFTDQNSFYIQSAGPQGPVITQVSPLGQVIDSTASTEPTCSYRQLWLPTKNGCLQAWFIGASDQPKPWICWLHGGPTGQQGPHKSVFDAYLDMGLVVVVVQFSGSTGLGRAHRQQLYGQWGVADVAQIIDVLEAGVNLGYLEREKGFIMGRSASGLSACLCAQQWPLAGLILYYPVVDTAALCAHMSHFEGPYTERLLGCDSPDPPNVPICHIHGDDDRVVPLASVEGWFSGVPAFHLNQLILPGQGHSLTAEGKEKASMFELGFIKKLLSISGSCT